ncbi:hypothetical protein [Jatrophihabitans fulvus]
MTAPRPTPRPDGRSGAEQPSGPPTHLPPAPPAAPSAPPGEPHVPAPTPDAEYRGTVVSPGQIALGVVSGAVLAVILLALGVWWAAILAFVLATAAGVWLAPVSVLVDRHGIAITQGRGSKESRVVHPSEIRAVELRQMSARDTVASSLGFVAGDDTGEKTTRLVVRPGPALVLTLNDGELIQLSVADGPAALAAVRAARTPR